MNIQPILDAFPLPAKRGILSDIDKDAAEAAIDKIIANPAEAAKALADKLKDPSTEGSDVQARHAMHATAIRIPKADRSARKTYSEALAATLADKRPDRVKGFIIRQLQVCGGKEAVPAIGKFLTTGGLADDAAQALLAIQDGAAEQFRAALPTAKSDTTLRQTSLHGLAQLADKASIPAFLDALVDKDGQCRLLGLWGLAQVADKATLDAFLKAEQKETGYARNQAAHLAFQFAEKLSGKDAAKVYKHIQDTRKDPTEKHLVELAKAAL